MKAKGSERALSASQLAQNLGPDRSEGQALELLSQWESRSPTQFCQVAVRAYLEASFDDLKAFAVADLHLLNVLPPPRLAEQSQLRAEKKWALKFFHRVQPLMEKGGGR
jgi:hypothetical protein